jgi:hypothetical protein
MEIYRLWAGLGVSNVDIDTARYYMIRMLWEQAYGEQARQDWEKLVIDWTNFWHLRWTN